MMAVLSANTVQTRLISRKGLTGAENLKPDLVVATFRVEPAKAAPGQKITLIYSIKNKGKGDITKKNINYSFYLSKNRILDPADLRILSIDKHGFTLKSGKTISRKGFIWRMPSLEKIKSAGIKPDDSVCYLLFVIDRKNMIRESRDDNNIKFTAIHLLR